MIFIFFVEGYPLQQAGSPLTAPLPSPTGLSTMTTQAPHHSYKTPTSPIYNKVGQNVSYSQEPVTPMDPGPFQSDVQSPAVVMTVKPASQVASSCCLCGTSAIGSLNNIFSVTGSSSHNQVRN